MKKALKVVGILFGLVLLLIVAFVGYVEATHKRDFSSTPLPAITASKDPAVIAQGEYVAHALAHCSACHGPGELVQQHKLSPDKSDFSGGYHMAAGPFGDFYPANLSSCEETGIGKMSDGHLARVIRNGVAPDGGYDPLMAFAVGPMADEDLTAVVSYLRTLPAKKNVVKKDEWGFIAKALAPKFQPASWPPPKYVPPGAASVERGEYLANGPAFCFGCHSQFDPTQGFKLVSARFVGATEPEPDPFDPGYEFVTPNLTPDPETGVMAAWTEQQFMERFRAGARFKGSKMPWDNFKQMTDDDLRSLYLYLETLPPTKNPTGPSYRAAGWKAG